MKSSIIPIFFIFWILLCLPSCFCGDNEEILKSCYYCTNEGNTWDAIHDICVPNGTPSRENVTWWVTKNNPTTTVPDYCQSGLITSNQQCRYSYSVVEFKFIREYSNMVYNMIFPFWMQPILSIWPNPEYAQQLIMPPIDTKYSDFDKFHQWYLHVGSFFALRPELVVKPQFFTYTYHFDSSPPFFFSKDLSIFSQIFDEKTKPKANTIFCEFYDLAICGNSGVYKLGFTLMYGLRPNASDPTSFQTHCSFIKGKTESSLYSLASLVFLSPQMYLGIPALIIACLLLVFMFTRFAEFFGITEPITNEFEKASPEKLKKITGMRHYLFDKLLKMEPDKLPELVDVTTAPDRSRPSTARSSNYGDDEPNDNNMESSSDYTKSPSSRPQSPQNPDDDELHYVDPRLEMATDGKENSVYPPGTDSNPHSRTQSFSSTIPDDVKMIDSPSPPLPVSEAFTKFASASLFSCFSCLSSIKPPKWRQIVQAWKVLKHFLIVDVVQFLYTDDRFLPEILSKTGTDYYFYLRFVRLLMWYCIIVGTLSCAVLLPVFLSDSNFSASIQDNINMKATSNKRALFMDFAATTIGSLVLRENPKNVYFLLIMVCFTIIGIVFVWNFYAMAKLSLIFQPRTASSASSDGSNRSNDLSANPNVDKMLSKESHKGLGSLHTVMVSKIPKSLKHSTVVTEDFESRYGKMVKNQNSDAVNSNLAGKRAVVGSSICFDLRELKEKKREEIYLQRKLEEAKLFRSKTGKKKVLLSRSFFGGLLKNICCKCCCCLFCFCGCCGAYFLVLDFLNFIFETINEIEIVARFFAKLDYKLKTIRDSTIINIFMLGFIFGDAESAFEKKLKKLRKKIEAMKQKKNITTTGYGFVTFSTPKIAKKCVQEHSISLCFGLIKIPPWCKFCDIFWTYRAESAPEPEDIVFDHLTYSKWNQLGRRILSNSSMTAILFCTFIVTFIMNVYYFFRGTHTSQINDWGATRGSVFVFSTFLINVAPEAIAILNEIAKPFILILSQCEKHHSYISYRNSALVKTIVFMVFNMIIIPNIYLWYKGVFCAVFYSNAPFDNYIFFYNHHTLNQMFLMVIITTIGKAGELGIFFLRMLIDFIREKKIVRPPFDYESSYGFKVTILYMAIINGSQIPILFPAVFIHLLISYYIEKWLILYVCAKNTTSAASGGILYETSRNVGFFLVFFPFIVALYIPSSFLVLWTWLIIPPSMLIFAIILFIKSRAEIKYERHHKKVIAYFRPDDQPIWRQFKYMPTPANVVRNFFLIVRCCKNFWYTGMFTNVQILKFGDVVSKVNRNEFNVDHQEIVKAYKDPLLRIVTKEVKI